MDGESKDLAPTWHKTLILYSLFLLVFSKVEGVDKERNSLLPSSSFDVAWRGVECEGDYRGGYRR